MLRYDEEGLIPAIAQDARTGQVLMLAYMNEEALARTLESGEAWFYSRSRQELWHKGETSGGTLRVQSIGADCDGDSLLLSVAPAGPVCHTGAPHCFFQRVTPAGLEPTPAQPGFRPSQAAIVEELFGVIQERLRTKPPGSYVASLLEGGVDQVAKKVLEEAGEVVIAAKNGKAQEIVHEVADLWFHTLLLLAATGLTPEAVWEELRRRRK